MKVQRLFFLLLLTALALPAVTTAQALPPDDTIDAQNQTAIPFDGLTTMLLAAGAGYAVKKGRAVKKRKQEKIQKQHNP